jgi:hypothetical protein
MNETKVDRMYDREIEAFVACSGKLNAKMKVKETSSRITLLIAAFELKMLAFWHIVPCSLVEVDLRFRGAYCLKHQS